MATGTVLLVDDEKDFTAALSARMEARGLSVKVAASGAEALELSARYDFDAIVLDLQMPEMDGIQTLRRLLLQKPGTSVIMLTGHGSIQQGVAAVKAGAVDFLEKPADIDTLMGKIKEAQIASVQALEERLDKKLNNIMKKKGW